MKNLILRYLIFSIGLYCLSLGMVLIVASSLGTTPISSLNYVLSLNTPLTLGGATFIFNMVLIIGQFLLAWHHASKKDYIEILLQIPFSVPFSIFIDFNMWLLEGLHILNYAMAVFILMLGCIIQGIGVALEIKPNVAMMSAEGFVKYTSRRFSRPFGTTKVLFDISLVIGAVILSWLMAGKIDGVREGTVIAALITGYIVTFMTTRIFTRANLRKVTFGFINK
ncbi:YitT family protein [uncultured Muribaculum sp.]|uniref:YczE/YyaS/YitT family protein n=1 Tax=uncultured Muribaculum sp. TaxID=1918613 RepID=UPI0026703CE2|nr:DUF6198 family protein [uncultured Muribaculum sp.]